jgi:hypothetical protein
MTTVQGKINVIEDPRGPSFNAIDSIKAADVAKSVATVQADKKSQGEEVAQTVASIGNAIASFLPGPVGAAVSAIAGAFGALAKAIS